MLRLAAPMMDDRGSPSAAEIFASQIVAVAERGDRVAFGALFGHFAPRVKAYLVRLGTSASVAEELSQEAMLVVWRKAAYYDPRKSQASTWIFTIARNLRIDAIRREARPELHPDEPALAPSRPLGAEETIAMSEHERRLRDALKTLPPDQAEVVSLSFFADKPHGDIGRELGIPLGTVKSRLRLAMNRLRAALGDVL